MDSRDRPRLPHYGPSYGPGSGSEREVGLTERAPTTPVALADAPAAPETSIDAPSQAPAPRARKPRFGTFWRATAIALLLFVGLNVLVAYSETYFMRVDSYDLQFGPAQALADYNHNPRPDIVFMGSSRPKDGFDPAIVDQVMAQRGVRSTSLNLAVGGSGADLAYLLLKNIIQDDKKPKIIVYGLAEFEFHQAFPGSSQLDYYSLLLRPDDMIGGKTLPDQVGSAAQAYAQAAIPIYRDRDLIRNALSIQFNPDDPSHKYYAPGPQHADPPWNGHLTVPANYQTTPYELQRDIAAVGPGMKYWNPGGATYQKLNALLDLAQARGIKVILVNMPVSNVHLSLWGPGNLENYLSLVRATAQRHNVPLVDLYTNPGGIVPQSGFVGTNHLNQGGAEVVSRLIGMYLATACADTLASSHSLPASAACAGHGILPPAVVSASSGPLPVPSSATPAATSTPSATPTR